MFRILVIGAVHIDVLADTEYDFLLPTVNDLPGTFSISLGGTAFNVCSWLVKLGADAFFISCARKDSLFTQFLRSCLKKMNLNYQLITESFLPEGGFVAIRKNGELFLAVTSSPWESLPANYLKKVLELQHPGNYDAILFDCNLTEEQITEVLKWSPEVNVFACTTSAVKALKLTRIDSSLRKKIKFVFCNKNEYQALKTFIFNTKSEETTYFVTCGKEGVMVMNKNRTLKFPAPRLKRVVSFSGTGDAFAAGVIYAIMKEENLEKSVKSGFKLVVECTKYSGSSYVEKMFRETLSSAGIDKLTGCLSRSTFEEEKEDLKGFTHVLLIDVDHFKKVNDTYGHDRGDEILRSVARIIRKSIRREDLLYRYGGEEFLLLLHRADDRIAAEVAERIRSEVQNKSPVTVTIGISRITESLDSAIKKADEALYEGKRSGRNRVILYHTEYPVSVV